MGPSKALENFFEQRHRQWEKRVKALLHSLGRDRSPHSLPTGAKGAPGSLKREVLKEESHHPGRHS